MVNINTLLSRKLSDLSINRFKTGYFILLYAALLAVLCVLVWVSFRGFDKTDESFYLVGFLQGIEPAFSYSQYHKLYNTFFGFLNLTIVEIRLLRILLTIVSSLLFSHALLSYLERINLVVSKKSNVHVVISSTIIGSFVAYIWPPQSLSYNFFSCLFLLLIVTFYFNSESTKSVKLKYLYQFIVGLFLAASFYNKFPNFFISIGAIISLSFLMPSKTSIAKKIGALASSMFFYSLGIVALILIFYKVQGFIKIDSLINMIMEAGEKSKYDYKHIYLNNFYKLFARMYPYILFVIFHGILYNWLVNTNKNKILIRIAEGLIIAFFVLFILTNQSYIGGYTRRYLHFDFYLIALTFFLGSLIVYKKIRPSSFSKILILYFFLLSFLLGSLGTNNGLSAQFIIYIVFILAAISIATIYLQKKFLYVIFILVLLTSTSQITTGVLLNPYREVHSIKEQKFEFTDLPAFRNLKVDSATYNLKTQLEGVKDLKEKYVYVYSHQLGYALLTNKTPYGFGWHSQWNPSFCVTLVENANKVEENDLIFVIPEKVGLLPEIQAALKQRGIFFPEHYKLYNQIIVENCKKGDKVKMNIYTYNDKH